MSMQKIPNDLNFSFYATHRYGDMCKRQPLKQANRSVQSLRSHYFTETGPVLFNLLPKSLKELTTMSTFKAHLDNYIQQFPDEPPVHNYPRKNNNSLVDWHNAGIRPISKLPIPGGATDDLGLSLHGETEV